MDDGQGIWQWALTDDEIEAVGFALDTGIGRTVEGLRGAMDGLSLGDVGGEARNLATLGRLRLRLVSLREPVCDAQDHETIEDFEACAICQEGGS
jgi:hypothetical protein